MAEVMLASKQKYDGIAFSVPACKKTIRRSGMTIGDQLDNMREVVKLAKTYSMLTRAYISYVMGSGYAKDIPPKEVNNIATDLKAMGVDEIVLQDPIAGGSIPKLLELLSVLKVPTDSLSVHFYDTKYTGLELVVAALSRGISSITCSIGGLGRSQHYDTILGSIGTEDLLFALECMGIKHEVNWKRTLKAGQIACELVGRENLADVYKVDFEEMTEKYKGQFKELIAGLK